MARPITPEEKDYAQQLLAKAREAMRAIADYDQATIDRLCQAVAWATSNETTFTRLAHMGVEESGIGDWEGRPGKRFKIVGILRDCLRQKSMGVVEELPEKGIVKYAKPVGVVCAVVPMTNPALTPAGSGICGLKAKDAIIFAPHPRTKNTSMETVRVMREALKRQGAPEDLFQCVEKPSIPLTQELMSLADLVIATGGQPMVRAAYSSGRPAYGVGAGNSTIVIDETANIVEAARNTRLSKTSDCGSGCSADGNVLAHASIYDDLLAQLIKEGGYLANDEDKAKLEAAMWDENGARTLETIAQPAAKLAERAGFKIPNGRTFIIVKQQDIGKGHRFSSEKLTTVLAYYKFDDFDEALDMVGRLYDVGGKGHSCGIYSFDDDHIDRLARLAPVSRMMVRQPQSKANGGAFNNGMPMTSSLGCGIWGGNITNENISLKHYLNFTWVCRPIAEDRPSDAELFGDFYQTETF